MTDLAHIRRTNLAALVEQHGLATVAKRTGKPASQINDMIAGRKSFGEKVARAIETAWGDPSLGTSWLDKVKLRLRALNTPEAEAEAEAQQMEEAFQMAQADEAALRVIAESKGFPARPITTYENLDELPPETTVLITHIDVALSAGNGRETWHIEEKEPLPFQADYIRRLDASPKNLVAVKVRGDSMEPRLFDDDTVVVDKADRRIPAGGGVFALVYAGEMLVKRLFRLPDGSLRVVSDNKEKHDPFIVLPEKLEHIDIVGRVKYRSGMGDF